MTNYQLVEWYANKISSFDNFGGDTRSEIIETSSDNFFSDMINKAKSIPGAKKGLEKLKAGDWRSEIQSNDKFDKDKVEEWFNGRLADILNKSRLVKTYKEEIDILSINSEDDLKNEIKEGKKIIEGFKEDFKSAKTREEREEVAERLKDEAPRTFASIRGWETRKGPVALDFVFSQLD